MDLYGSRWAAFVALPILFAAPAHADADDDFLAALDSHNITYDSRQEAVIAGHTVCDKLRDETPYQVAYDVLHSSHLDEFHSGFFVGASMRAYCPQYIKWGHA